VEGQPGGYTATLKVMPRYVNANCTACGECAKVSETEFDDEYNYDLGKRKGAYLPFNMAYPARYVLDARIIGTGEADKAKQACKYDAIDLDMQEQQLTLNVGAIIWATGWRPYDANKIQPYCYGRFPNVISSVEFERMLDPFGPTAGKILRPSDGKEARDVAFIQCAGSRDINHLRHCSRICCKGCGLGERLDTAQLATIAAREGKASVVREHDFLCSGNGVQMIQNDIDTEGVNRVVICACSRRAKSEAFNFDNMAIARANLREGVIWVRPDTDEARETIGEMAADYVRMCCLEAKHMTPPSANKEAASDDHILIVGGGVSGMTAAIESARAGYPVTIVEKAGQLGGATGLMWKDMPAHSPYTDPVDTDVEKLTKELENSDKITVHLNSVVTRTSGATGRLFRGHQYRIRRNNNGELRCHHYGVRRKGVRCQPVTRTGVW